MALPLHSSNIPPHLASLPLPAALAQTVATIVANGKAGGWRGASCTVAFEQLKHAVGQSGLSETTERPAITAAFIGQISTLAESTDLASDERSAAIDLARLLVGKLDHFADLNPIAAAAAAMAYSFAGESSPHSRSRLSFRKQEKNSSMALKLLCETLDRIQNGNISDDVFTAVENTLNKERGFSPEKRNKLLKAIRRKLTDIQNFRLASNINRPNQADHRVQRHQPPGIPEIN